MMKKRFFKSGRAFCVAASVLALCMLLGCTRPGGEEKTPSLVSITAETDKTDYIKGQSLDLDAIKVSGTYSDGSVRALTFNIDDVSGYDPDQEGAQTITVTVEQNIATFTVTVMADPGEQEQWSYTVTFNSNGGGGDPATNTVKSPDTTLGSLPSAPARNGYIFTGWNTREDGAGSAFAGTTTVTGNITLYAQWTALVNAQAPVITTQPRSAAYNAGDTPAALTATASSPDGGSLSYQWYSVLEGGEGTPIEAATGPSYLPPIDTEGAISYYVRITNTNNSANGTQFASVNSDTVTVTVTVMVTVVNALAPDISVQPRDAEYIRGATAAALTVTAASPDGGSLSYQWYSVPEGGEGTPIEAATGSSYLPSTAAEGVVAYYVRVTNTNSALSGTKTAAAESETVTVTVKVNAQAPIITAQPQGAELLRGTTAAALNVAAASQDGGVISFQWYSSTGSGYTAIPGATGSSYAPSTATAGYVSYYVQVTNTNNSVSGVKTAAVNSAAAVVKTLNPGTGGFMLTFWVNDDGSLISDMLGTLDISRSRGDSFSVVAAEGLNSLQWAINGEPHSAAQSIVIEAVNYPAGSYQLSLYAEKDGVPYSITITFVVNN